jgi:hypothetical protein
MQDVEMNQWLLELLKFKPERSPNHETISSDLITLEN